MKNLLIIEKAALAQSQLDGLRLVDGAVVLANDRLHGTLLTPVYDIASADTYVLSFNALTQADSAVNLAVRLIGEAGQSMWFSYGDWAVNANRSASIRGQSDYFARLRIDELIVAPEATVRGVQFKAVLTRAQAASPSPQLQRIYLTNMVAPTYTAPPTVPEIDYTVPQRSQMVVPEIGRQICSPTSLCMVLQYYGEALEPADVAQAVFDHGAKIYGNWSYNVAYAAEQGYQSFVYFCQDKAELFDLLAQGRPIIASIRTAQQDELRGAPQAYPQGHLVVVAGATNGENGPALIVNDPAARSQDDVRRHYSVDDFMRVWSGIVYVVIND